MRLHNENDFIVRHRMDGMIGLELESHRIDRSGNLAGTPHPFPGNRYIDRDYSEDQIEINTPPEIDEDHVLKFLHEKIQFVQRKLKLDQELIWPFSNPPFIRSEDDIKIAQYYGEDAANTTYREYLARRYGKYKMTYSGIHFNYSFSDELLKKNFELDGAENYREYKDRFYLKLAERTLEYSWVIVALLAASPLVDNSFYESGNGGRTVFTGTASLRCSEHGYWNQFTPVLSYESIEAYVNSIRAYVSNGLLTEERELYYPVRLKPAGKFSLDGLLKNGTNHIELRMIDLNPFAEDGIDIRDVKFLKLFLIWLASRKMEPLSQVDQVQAIQNYKNSAGYDWRIANISDTAGVSASLEFQLKRVLSEMSDFYESNSEDIAKVLEYQYSKVESAENRYAFKVRNKFERDYIKEGVKLAIKKQEKANV